MANFDRTNQNDSDFESNQPTILLQLNGGNEFQNISVFRPKKLEQTHEMTKNERNFFDTVHRRG